MPIIERKSRIVRWILLPALTLFGTWGVVWATDALFVAPNGNVGIGTNSVGDAGNEFNKFHLSRAGIVLALFQSSDNNAVQVRFKTNSPNRRFLAVDSNNVPKSQILFGDGEVKFSGQTDTSNLFATFNASGMDINGAIKQRGGTVHPDYVFEDSFDLEPIDVHAQYMYEHKHLKAVGPGTYAEDGTPTLDVGTKMMGMLEELEKAHIYIDQLHKELRSKDAKIAQIDTRISKLEALLSAND